MGHLRLKIALVPAIKRLICLGIPSYYHSCYCFHIVCNQRICVPDVMWLDESTDRRETWNFSWINWITLNCIDEWDWAGDGQQLSYCFRHLIMQTCARWYAEQQIGLESLHMHEKLWTSQYNTTALPRMLKRCRSQDSNNRSSELWTMVMVCENTNFGGLWLGGCGVGYRLLCISISKRELSWTLCSGWSARAS